MWKCSTNEGKSLCPCNPKITVLLGALILVVLVSIWLMAATTDFMSDRTTRPLDPTEKTLIGIPVATTDLSPAEHEAALAQERCPVTGTPLSEATEPAMINYNGREIYVYSKVCVPMFEANPERYLANLQGTCPVCGADLSTVMEPCKFTYQGQDIYFHSAECEKEFLANPDPYLKNLK